MNSSSAVPLIGQNQPQADTKPLPLTTAFVVWTDHLGRVGFSPDPNLLADDVSIARPASADDMYGAAANVLRQLTTQFTAVETHEFMITRAQAAARAAEDARIAATVNHSRPK